MCVPLLQKSLFCETEYNKRKEQVFFSLRNFNRHILDCMFVIFVCVRVFCCKATGRRLYKKKSWEGKVNFCISFFFLLSSLGGGTTAHLCVMIHFYAQP